MKTEGPMVIDMAVTMPSVRFASAEIALLLIVWVDIVSGERLSKLPLLL